MKIKGDIYRISNKGEELKKLMEKIKNKREIEKEEDEKAIRYLQDNNISTEPLLELLISLDSKYDEEDTGVSNYFSSHPATIERIKKLKRR